MKKLNAKLIDPPIFKIKGIFNKFISLFFFILIWYIFSNTISDSMILPTPYETFLKILDFAKTGVLFSEFIITFLRSIYGLSASLLCGIFLGTIMGFSKIIYKLISPIITFLQSTPVISWLLLALIWFSSDIIPIFIVAVAVLPVITINTAEGLVRTDKNLLEMAELYNVPFRRIIKEIYIPQIMGYLLSGIKIAVGITFRVSVMAEVLSHPGNGIGEKMSWARINIETADIIAWTIVIITATLILDYFVERIFNKISRKYNA